MKHEQLVEVLKAAGEATRLRLLALLANGDLTVTDMTEILAQSQPRISRHLKLLGEAGLIDRYQEGAWAFFRLKESGAEVALVRLLLASASWDDAVLSRDQDRLAAVKAARSEKAQEYFSRNAAEWDEMRRLHVSEAAVEAKLAAMIGTRPIDAMLDLGTGTGRMLQLFEKLYRRGVGVDTSRDMLAVARANLDKAGIIKASVRQGDIFNLSLDNDEFDLVTIHQVLHFLVDPLPALMEAARVLKPGGRLAIIDFAPHKLEHLRDQHAHMRLGFSTSTIQGWCQRAGLVVNEAEDLVTPGTPGESLTVTIWLATKQPRQSNPAIPTGGDL